MIYYTPTRKSDILEYNDILSLKLSDTVDTYLVYTKEHHLAELKNTGNVFMVNPIYPRRNQDPSTIYFKYNKRTELELFKNIINTFTKKYNFVEKDNYVFVTFPSSYNFEMIKYLIGALKIYHLFHRNKIGYGFNRSFFE